MTDTNEYADLANQLKTLEEFTQANRLTWSPVAPQTLFEAGFDRDTCTGRNCVFHGGHFNLVECNEPPRTVLSFSRKGKTFILYEGDRTRMNTLLQLAGFESPLLRELDNWLKKQLETAQ